MKLCQNYGLINHEFLLILSKRVCRYDGLEFIWENVHRNIIRHAHLLTGEKKPSKYGTSHEPGNNPMFCNRNMCIFCILDLPFLLLRNKQY